MMHSVDSVLEGLSSGFAPLVIMWCLALLMITSGGFMLMIARSRNHDAV